MQHKIFIVLLSLRVIDLESIAGTGKSIIGAVASLGPGIYGGLSIIGFFNIVTNKDFTDRIMKYFPDRMRFFDFMAKIRNGRDKNIRSVAGVLSYPMIKIAHIYIKRYGVEPAPDNRIRPM